MRQPTDSDEDAILGAGIEERLAAIEKRLAELEAVVRAGGQFQFVPAAFPKARRRRAGLLDHELRSRRDNLYEYCSFHWPELTLVIAKAKSAEDLKAYLEFGFTSTDTRYAEAAMRLITNASALFAFKRSGRYHGDPIQVANALAGIPELKWRTSWNRCSSIPPIIRAHPRSFRDRLRRRFTERFRELIRAKRPESILDILKRTRSDDEIIDMFRHLPDKVPEFLQEGSPRWSPI